MSQDENFYQRSDVRPETYTGQYILTKIRALIPNGWTRYSEGQWHLGVAGLPVLNVESLSGQRIGWCLGYPIADGRTWVDGTTIKVNTFDSRTTDSVAVEQFYEQTSGRYLLILLAADEQRVFLDPYGSLAAVFSVNEPIICSTPTLMPDAYAWDHELIGTLDMPESGLWFPFGLTPKSGVRRLLPNHYLNLEDLSVHRHWPSSRTDLAVDPDVRAGVHTITSRISRILATTAAKHRIEFTLTAGRDSRMVLACSRDLLQRILFFTYAVKDQSVDTHIASLMAKRFNLEYEIVPVQNATTEQLRSWLFLTGHAIGGAIWKIHKSMENLRRDRVLINGIAGEVGRAFYWRSSDREDLALSARELLERCGIPATQRIVQEAESWLAELTGFNTFNMLDLFYIEQRLGCWAAPQHYANIFSLFEFSPFNDRTVLKSMMTLPYQYRMEQGLARDVCLETWPDLLAVPFNRHTGIRRYTHEVMNRANKVASLGGRIIRKAAKVLTASVKS